MKKLFAEAVKLKLGSGSNDRRLGGLLVLVSIVMAVCTVVQTVNSFNIRQSVKETAASLTADVPPAVTMAVRKLGDTEYAGAIIANPGDVVQFRMTAQNIAIASQDLYAQIGFSSQNGGDIAYIPGSAVLADADNPGGLPIGDDVALSGASVLIGHMGRFLPNGSVSVRVDAKISEGVTGTHTMGAIGYANCGDSGRIAKNSATVVVVDNNE